MVRACIAAVHKATGDVFSDAEVDDLLNRTVERARRLKRDKPTLDDRTAIRAAAAELTREEIADALVDQRLRLASKKAGDARKARLDAMPADMDEAKRLAAYDVGSERQGRFTSSSVDAEGRARAMSLWGQVELGLNQRPGLMNRISNFWNKGEKEFDRKIAKELARINGDGKIEPTGDEDALHAARVLATAMEAGRQAQNDQGAWIGKLDGYIARQSHDRLKIAGGFWRELGEIARRLPADKLKALDWDSARLGAAKRAFREWRDFIRPRLDEVTFAGLDGSDMKALDDAAALASKGVIDDPGSLEERFLYKVWSDIVTGRHEVLTGGDDLGEFKPPPSKARSVSKSRVLHFSSPDAWVDYNGRFGGGSLFKAVMGQLDRAGRNAALMERWGPAPEASRAATIERLSNEARARGAVDVVNRLNSNSTKANFDELTGQLNSPESLRLAITARNIRAWEGLTKLGSMVLSAVSDIPIAGQTFARTGAGFLHGYDGAIRGLLRMQSADAKRAADLLDVGARSFAGHVAGRFTATDGAAGWMAWGARLQSKLQGADFWIDGMRQGGAEMFSRQLGEEAKADWAGLEIGTRETLERFGIDAPMWDLARQGLEPAADGRTYFTLENLARIPDRDLLAHAGQKGQFTTAQVPAAAAKIRGEIDLRFRTMIHNVLDDLVSEPRARERVAVTRGTRAGTVWGEAARIFTQFHSFAAAVLGRQLVPAAAGYAGKAPVALLAHLIVATTLAGFLSMQAKMIVKGQTPRDLVDKDGNVDLKVWGAAMVQGGGLGIYGDFLFGDHNRQGVGFSLSAFAGPALSDAEKVAQLVYRALHGDGTDGSFWEQRQNVGGQAVKFGSSQIPMINLWQTRLILDYLVLWRMQEAASPGYLERYESRVRDDGGDFLLPPTSAQ